MKGVQAKALRITAPHFCAGVELDAYGLVTRAAPIVAYMRRDAWSETAVRNYCDLKNWIVEELA